LNTWITAQASVIGAGHIKSDKPCQDSNVVKLTKDNQWLVIVVSDGAGSAKRAEEGSSYVSKFMANELFKLIEELKHKAPGHWVNDFIIKKILTARLELRAMAGADDINDFNCTLVACLIGPEGGFSVHIGDGNIIGGYKVKSTLKTEYKFYHSLPENGEYANETFFITENDWIKHLRISPIPSLDWVLCCSDGGASLALEGEKNPKSGFLIPVVQSVFNKTGGFESDSRLKGYLEDPQADNVTSDDKTIVLGCRPFFIESAKNYLELSSKSDQKAKRQATEFIQGRNVLRRENNARLMDADNLPTLVSARMRVVQALSVTAVLIIFVGIFTYYLSIPDKERSVQASRYFGELKYGEKTGPGLFWFKDQEIYSGEYKNNQRDGIGAVEYADGGFYAGSWMGGQKNGEGIYRGADGIIQSGHWSKGIFKGEESQRVQNGAL